MNEFRISGMKCESCVDKISSTLRDAGYADAQVTLNPPTVRLSLDSVSSDELQEIISKAGDYKVSAQIESYEEINNNSLIPLFVVISYVVGSVLLQAVIVNDFSFDSLMNNFMGFFFIIFSLFKLLNLNGFTDAFATYNILAARSRTYGLLYPFVELILGIAYVTKSALLLSNVITLILMLVGSVGVFQALKTKRKFQCACLGTALKLPMTKVTLFENITMGLMALIAIINEAPL